MNCDDSRCNKILVDPPETATVPANVPKVAAPTTSRPPIVQSGEQGNEKGPSQPDLAYYASQLTNANMNSEKGPNTDAMAYLPEHFMQAQMGTPGSRGPPGPPGAMVIKYSI